MITVIKTRPDRILIITDRDIWEKFKRGELYFRYGAYGSGTISSPIQGITFFKPGNFTAGYCMYLNPEYEDEKGSLWFVPRIDWKRLTQLDPRLNLNEEGLVSYGVEKKDDYNFSYDDEKCTVTFNLNW